MKERGRKELEIERRGLKHSPGQSENWEVHVNLSGGIGSPRESHEKQ